jgi:hypothetical protein
MLRTDWQEFESYLAPNVGNVVFADASGKPVYAWCESSCSNTQPVSNIWVREDEAIPASGEQEMFMYIFPTTQIEYNSSGYWGAFPIITATYGQYDNGPKVFDFYSNFNGSVLCSCLKAVPFLGGGGGGGSQAGGGGSAYYSVGNGLTITATGSATGAGYGYHIYLDTPGSFSAVDSNLVATNAPTTSASVSSGAAYRYDAMDLVAPSATYQENGFNSSYSAVDEICGGSCTNSFSLHLDGRAPAGSGSGGSTIATGTLEPWIGIQSLVWPVTGSEFANYMELQRLQGTDGTLVYSPSYADIAFINSTPQQYYMTFHWMRTRNAPPNDVMPSVSFGSVIPYT